MEFTENIEIHYPVTVLQRDFIGVDDLNTSLFNNILSLEKISKDKNNNAVETGQITTEGGYQTPLNFNYFSQQDEIIQSFKNNIILPAVQDYLKEVFGSEGKSIQPWLVGWANILRDGNWQRPHFHPTQSNVISGVYYVKLPETLSGSEGCIEFINPMPISINHGFSNTRKIKPQEGKLILFPPYYMHYVYPFKSSEDRAVIAFDVLTQAPGLQFMF